MAIVRLTPENFETYEIVAHPTRTFQSSSNGITGSFLLLQDNSPCLKDPDHVTKVVASSFDEDSRIDLVQGTLQGTQHELDIINSASQGLRYRKRQEILRSTPGVKFDKNYLKKQTIKESLFPYYRYLYPTLEWAYTNYNSLNFFNNDSVPTNSALIYPAGTGTNEAQDANFYAPSSSFTFDFWIKPRYTQKFPNTEFHAGTILHMSSCFALSLVSGSSVGPDGRTDRFRILMQLSQSADIPPSQCKLGPRSITAISSSADKNLIFASSDNVLPKDRWTHVGIRWPGGFDNGGSGSFVINGKEDRAFSMALTKSCMQTAITAYTPDDPNGLFVGNYYEGGNTGASSIARFFSPTISAEEGLTPFSDSADSDATGYRLRHPLQAEVHEIKIYNSAKSISEISSSMKFGPEITKDMLFYLPPFFTQHSRSRNVLQTPFFDAQGKTEDPFNVALSFGLGALDINLQNFTREMVRGEYPRLLNLSSSKLGSSQQAEGVNTNTYLYASSSARKKLLTILPCDNGLFMPNFNLLATGSELEIKYKDTTGARRLDFISLENMVSTASLPTGLMSTQFVPARTFDELGTLSVPTSLDDSNTVQYGSGSFLFDLQGASPEDPAVDPGSILTILQRTGDPSSNEVTFFDISNLFYGDRIYPNSLIVQDLEVTGSGGSMTFTLKDDGLGNLYRDDLSPSGTPATWASVGNVLYDEGLIVIKTPHLPFFGKDNFKISFKGERKVYVLEVSVPAHQNLFNSSSNPTYKDLIPSDYSNEVAEKFTYITGLQLHDDNFNIVGRAHLAQPFVKRDEDKVVIKLRMDF